MNDFDSQYKLIREKISVHPVLPTWFKSDIIYSILNTIDEDDTLKNTQNYNHVFPSQILPFKYNVENDKSDYPNDIDVNLQLLDDILESFFILFDSYFCVALINSKRAKAMAIRDFVLITDSFQQLFTS